MKKYFEKITVGLLRESQWYSEEDLYQLKLEGLQDLLVHARKHTKYYKKLPEIKDLESIDRLTVLTKDTIHEKFDQLTADNIPNRTKWTGGTCQQVIIKTPRNERPLYAGKTRFLEWQGVKDIREACLWGLGELSATVGIRGPAVRNKTLFLPIEQLRTKEDALRYMKLIESFKPNKIRGYPSAMTYLAYYALEEGFEYTPEVIETNCEPLTEYKKNLLKEVFKAPVFVFYGSQDLGSMAQNCNRDEGLHLFAERYILEVTEEGRFLWTDLLNYAMPLIRYENGDGGKFVNKTCSCGRVLPMIHETLGRTLYFLLTKNDQWLNMTEIHEQMYWHIPHFLELVDRHQIIQEEKGKCALTLKVWDLNKKPDTSALLEYFKRLGLEIELKYTTKMEDIVLSKSGKQLSCITKFRPPWLGKETSVPESM